MIVVAATLFWSGLIIHICAKSLKSLLASLLIASIGLVLPATQGRPGFPLAWLPLPVSAWIGIVCIAAAGLSIFRILGKPDSLRPKNPWGRPVLWLLCILPFAIVFFASDDQVKWCFGVAPFSITTCSLMLITIIVVALSVRTSQLKTSFSATPTRLVHFVLVIGSMIFAIPLIWMLLTSLREDQFIGDASQSSWLPTVSVVAPYDNPRDPFYQIEFQGSKVQARLDEILPSGQLVLFIETPAMFRGKSVTVRPNQTTRIPREVPVVELNRENTNIRGIIIKTFSDGRQMLRVLSPKDLADSEILVSPTELSPLTKPGLRFKNYSEAFQSLPADSLYGWVFLRNTLILIVMTTLGTLFSSSIVAYAFARVRFPGKNGMFMILMSTMMLPGAVTMLPTFLIFRWLGWIDTLYPLWVPSFFAGAFNVFLLRQFFRTIPSELEDAARIDGCSHWTTYWRVMLPIVKPALVCIAVWTFMGAWGNFMGPLIYVNTPERMPIAYALQLFSLDKGGEPGMMMAMSTMAMLPILLLFFFAQRYFIEGVTLTGIGGR